jgi:predicted NBD/HSP70 family sugar kinase
MEAARAGEPLAQAIVREAGLKLGEAVAILIDLFNPERVVIGGFFPLCRDLLEPPMTESLAQEALALPLASCRILPSMLGATVGSHGAIAVALRAFRPRPLSTSAPSSEGTSRPK